MKKKRFQNFTNKHFGIIALLPAAILVLIIFSYPIISNLFYSFTNKKLIESAFNGVGFQNYTWAFKNKEFWISMRNSIIYTLGSVVGQLAVGLVLALILNRGLRGFKTIRTMLILPWMMPIAVVVIIWRWMFNSLYGIVPFLLSTIGCSKASFFGSGVEAMATVIFVDVWRAFPLMMLSIIAALLAIPHEEYEVAAVEGASTFQVFRYVTFPNICSAMGTVVMLRTIWTFNDFNRVYLMTGGGPGIATQTLPIIVYKTGTVNLSLGRASAICVIMLMVLSLLVFLYFKMFRIEGEGS